MKKQLCAIAAFWHREYGRFVGITALAFLALTVLAYIVGRLVPNVPVTIIRTFNESIADAGIIRDDGSFSALALFGNNLRAMVMTVLYGFIPFLYLPALSLGLNAAIIGMLAALMDGQWLLLLCPTASLRFPPCCSVWPPDSACAEISIDTSAATKKV